MNYVPPDIRLPAFTCPHCGAYAQQRRYSVVAMDLSGSNQYQHSDPLASARCEHCKEYTLWLDGRMVHPHRGDAPPPNPAMPDEVKALYEEAASVAGASPRAAAALLRLAVQLLCIELGGKGKNINADIGLLVEQGLPKTVKKSLDILRVTGSHAVHPGTIDVDDPKVAGALFRLMNVIVERMIAEPKEIEAIHSALPEGTLKQIEERDAKDGEA